jgi:hypothetical protein
MVKTAKSLYLVNTPNNNFNIIAFNISFYAYFIFNSKI